MENQEIEAIFPTGQDFLLFSIALRPALQFTENPIKSSQKINAKPLAPFSILKPYLGSKGAGG
jgi:hypothetical protein